MSANQIKNVVILGAGVIGLTTAQRLQEKGGYRVTIIAETIPTDPKTIKYTSHWAGAHHVSSIKSEINQETFETMWALSAPGGEAEGCFLRLPQTEYYDHARPQPDPLMIMPNFRIVSEDELPQGAACGTSFETVTIDVPVFLNYLFARFLARGGEFIRASVQHISQIIQGGYNSPNDKMRSTPDGIIVCAGLGARYLGGVEDKSVFPARGQTVILRAPWVREGKTFNSARAWTYIIPRKSGDVVVGGTRSANDWYPLARPEVTDDILSRGLELCPELAPPEIRAQRAPTVDDLRPLISQVGVGLRPMREGGIRLDFELMESPSKGRIPIVYNYGHQGTGFMASYGSGSKALELLEKGLIAASDSALN